MLNTVKRNLKGKSLTHQEFDNNWTSIENAINAKAPALRYNIAISGYEINDDSLKLFIAVEMLQDVTILPDFKCWVVDEGEIVAIGNCGDLYLDSDYPIQSGTALVKHIRVEYVPNHEGRGAIGTIYLQDALGHFSNNLSIPNYIILEQADD